MDFLPNLLEASFFYELNGSEHAFIDELFKLADDLLLIGASQFSSAILVLGLY
jgi:hypothetical protein